jgi:hypothetical protein
MFFSFLSFFLIEAENLTAFEKMYLWLKFTYIKHFLGNKKVLTLACVAGMDPKCHYALGSLIDGIAIWFTANACLCSRQALALLISSYVCLSFSPFIFLLNKSNHLSGSVFNHPVSDASCNLKSKNGKARGVGAGRGPFSYAREQCVWGRK